MPGAISIGAIPSHIFAGNQPLRATYVRDYFLDVDATLLSTHIPNIGDSWNQGSGGFNIDVNTLISTAAAFNEAYIGVGSPNVEIQMDILGGVSASGNAQIGILFRGDGSTANYWIWRLIDDGAASVRRMTLGQTVAGTFAEVSTDDLGDIFSSSTGDVLRIRLQGTQITGYLNDTQVFTRADTFSDTGESHGVFIYNADTNAIDNFQILGA